MRKHLLLLAAVLMLAVSAQARIINPGENQVWWGYFNESDFENGDYTIGTGSAMALMGAIYIPANHEQLGTATVKAIRIYFPSSAVSSLSGLKVWISKELPEKINDADYVQTTLGSVRANANDYSLRTPYEINNEGFYVGYYVKSTTGYFIRCGGNESVANSFWIGNPEAGMGWSDISDGYGFGKLAFQILVEGGNFPSNSVTPNDFGQNFVLKGESVNVPITITNKGQNPVSSISYTIATEGGSVTPETTLLLGSLAFNSSKVVDINFPADEETRKYKKTFTITKVDDQENTATSNSAEGFVITMKEKHSVTPVIEEFTGTWCGWCPRGMVGMEKVHETYGDQVVQIAAHSGDVMEIDAYSSVINKFAGGFPSSITDRQFDEDPSFSGLKSALNNAFNRVAAASVELIATWETDAQKAVVFNTKTKFSYNDDNSQFALAFVLTEDGLKGTGDDWKQANYYSGQSVSGDMDWWCKQGSSVSGVEFNHVAVAGWSVLNGISGSIDPVIDADVVQEYRHVGRISGNSLIKDKKKLKAIALLIDRTNGTIVNAAQSDIMEPGTAISAVSAKSNVPAALFSVDGRKLSTVEKGVNIVRMTDGTVKKVLIK